MQPAIEQTREGIDKALAALEPLVGLRNELLSIKRRLGEPMLNGEASDELPQDSPNPTTEAGVLAWLAANTDRTDMMRPADVIRALAKHQGVNATKRFKGRVGNTLFRLRGKGLISYSDRTPLMVTAAGYKKAKAS